MGKVNGWNAFTIRKQKNDIDGMQFYGRIIHKLQKKLKLLPTEFDIYIGDEYDYDEENDDKDVDSSSYYVLLHFPNLLYSTNLKEPYS